MFIADCVQHSVGRTYQGILHSMSWGSWLQFHSIPWNATQRLMFRSGDGADLKNFVKTCNYNLVLLFFSLLDYDRSKQ
jgi:hypothetical protein